MWIQDTTAWGTYWYWGPNGGGAPGQKPCNGAPVRAGEGHVDVPTYYTAFHEYAVEWTPTSLTYLVDGKPYKTYCPTTLVLIPPLPPYPVPTTQFFSRSVLTFESLYTAQWCCVRILPGCQQVHQSNAAARESALHDVEHCCGGSVAGAPECIHHLY